jgi:hypothetical protein
MERRAKVSDVITGWAGKGVRVQRHLGMTTLLVSGIATVALLLLLAGCSLNVTEPPNVAKPTCGWSSPIPANGDKICAVAYRTLATLTTAEVRGDNRQIRRLVANPAVARRIIRYGQQVRAQRVQSFHPVPNPLLALESHSKIDVAVSLVGKTRQYELTEVEAITVQIRHGRAIIIADQPGEEW